MGNIFSISLPSDAIFSCCLDCTVRKATYVCNLEDNLLELEIELEKLVEARNDVTMMVSVAEQQQMKRLNQVQGWLSRVEAVEIEVGKLMADRSRETQKLCLGGCCSKNCVSSYKFGKKVVKLLQDVDKLKREGDFKDVAKRKPEDPVDERPIEPTIVGMQSTFDKVWSCLSKESVGIIGLYGMGGVGKTTLLTQINNRFLNAQNDFDAVIWVVVSKDLQIEKIQESIGKKIGLSDTSWRKKSLEDKAMDICRILSKKKFVLLLDDLWERVDLIKVGVPLPSPRIQQIASKIVFTTRFEGVCGLMEAHKKFKVECLPELKAWELFQKKVGEDTLDSHHDICDLAKIVANECGGLPLALITIGRAMSCKKTPEEWRYAIQVLKNSAHAFPGMEEEVYPLLKFSYDSLSSNTIRSCLLYCSLFPEDYSIRKSDLIDCWIGEGFFGEYDHRGAQNEGYHIIGVLSHACLLEEEGDDCVKMHDVIRDMTLWIACEIEKKNGKFLVLAGAALTETPKVRKWEGVKRMSLMKNRIKSLSESPTCPYLLTLFLNHNQLEMINDDFFQYMSSLIVLNLSNNNGLQKLPSDVSRLVSLQHLDLSGTSIKELPEGLKALVNLRCLNLEYTQVLSIIPRQLISNFSKLLVLRMFLCGIEGHVTEDSVLFGGSEFLVEELLCLKHLNVLSVTIKSIAALQKFLSSHMLLQECTQSLSLQYFNDSKPLNVLLLEDLKQLERLHIRHCKYFQELNLDYAWELQRTREPHVFRNLHTFQMSNCMGLKDLTWLVFAPNLKDICIRRCADMEEIVSVEKLGGVGMMKEYKLNHFAKLQYLRLEHLPNLKSIYGLALPFPHLKELMVSYCPDFKKLPLDISNLNECKFIIKGEERWWKELKWDNLATQIAYQHCFKNLFESREESL